MVVDDTVGVRRIIETQGWIGTIGQRAYDLNYCFNAGSTAPNCGATAANDRSKIQWVGDSLSGQSTAYTYYNRVRVMQTVTTGSGAAMTIVTARSAAPAAVLSGVGQAAVAGIVTAGVVIGAVEAIAGVASLLYC